MIDFNKISDIFCLVDEFCKDFDNTTKGFLLGKPSKRPAIMSKSEVISICMLFHLSGFRCFKHFYLFYVQRHMQGEFPRTVSYNRFIELSQGMLMPMAIFLKPVVWAPVQVFRSLIPRLSGSATTNGSKGTKYLKA